MNIEHLVYKFWNYTAKISLGPTLELDDSFDDTNKRFVRRIQETEIGEALKRMKGGKAIGPDGIPLRCGDA
jgi:hypothetical protein